MYSNFYSKLYKTNLVFVQVNKTTVATISILYQKFHYHSKQVYKQNYTL